MTERAPGRALTSSSLLWLGLASCPSEHGLPSAGSVTKPLEVASANSSTPVSAPVVDLWLGGDVHWSKGRNVAGRLAPLADLVRGSIGSVNLEGPLSPAGPGALIAADGTVTLSNNVAFLPALRDIDARFVGIANNHADDLGVEGISATREHLSAAGLAPVGLSAGVHSTELAGLKVHIAAYDLTTSQPVDRSRELVPLGREPGLLIVTFHETGPPSYLPSARLRVAVDDALAHGADIVVSHGTHALGPVERRGDKVIGWGLGNLLFDCMCTTERDGLLLRVRATDASIEATVIPVDAGLGDAPAQLSHDPALIFDLLESIGSSPLRPEGDRASF